MRYIKQEGLKDCGVCSLYNIIRFYKGKIDYEKLRKMTETDDNGTSIYNLVRASNKIGFKSKALKCSYEELETLTFPLIAFIKIKNYNHFVIINDVDNEKVVLFDPIRGRIIFKKNDFLKEWQNIVITYEKEKELPIEKDYYVDYLITIMKENRNQIIILLLTSFLCVLLSIFFTNIIKNIFNYNIKSKTITFYLFVILFKSIVEFFKTKFAISLTNNLDYSLSSKVYKKIFSLPLSYHHSRPVGDLVSKINDLFNLKDFISYITLSSIIDALSITLILFITLFISFKIFLLFLVITFLLFFVFYYYKNEQKILLDNVKEENAKVNSSFIENLLGIDTIKHLNIEEKTIDKQINNKNSFIKQYSKYMSKISIHNLFSSFLEYYGLIIIMLIGYRLLNKNKISIGILSMIYTLFILYFNSLKNLIELYKYSIDSKISYKKLYSLLTLPTSDNNKNIKDINSIKFINISYSYNDTKIFSKYNLSLKKGENVIICGESGNGKSTLFKLLNKELLYSAGDILIDDISLNDISEKSIRNNICYVSQQEYLFTDTIKNNILMNQNVKTKELNKVIKVVMLDKILKKRNIDLNYVLEDNGHNLCGGERQRILIARALLRNTNFIIFDETMNEIDIKNERKILENIITEYKKTIILISHRESNEDLFKRKIII